MSPRPPLATHSHRPTPTAPRPTAPHPSSCPPRRTFNAAGHQCGDGMDVWEGFPFGAVRCTFGFHSSLADADAVAAMVKECFVGEPSNAPSA